MFIICLSLQNCNPHQSKDFIFLMKKKKKKKEKKIYKCMYIPST